MMKISQILLCLTCATALSGCTSRHVVMYDGYESVSPSLVTPSESMQAVVGSQFDEVGWEYGRNDPPRRSPVMSYDIAEVRHWETLRTSGTQPREYTTTRSRSIRWIQSP